ncbi:MAG TPA: amidohydrolase family protein, partial [Longimicrobium sp.]|nr:amidohydrolase family protein [Longimicrobium sp.]
MHPFRFGRTSLALLAAALLLTPAPAPAQTIYVARTIHTMKPGRDVATAVAVDGGYIRAVGSLDSVRAAVGGGYTVDSTTFHGQVLLPGFVEAHTHLQFYGLFSRVPYVGYFDHPGPDGTLAGIQSPDSLVRFLRSAVARQDSITHQDTLPLLASGADPIYFGGTRFTKALLDSVSTVTPILLQLGSGHLVIVNTPMLRLLEEDTSAWAALPAASVVRDAEGNPTGELDELQAVDLGFAVFLKTWARLRPPGFTTPERMGA